MLFNYSKEKLTRVIRQGGRFIIMRYVGFFTFIIISTSTEWPIANVFIIPRYAFNKNFEIVDFCSLNVKIFESGETRDRIVNPFRVKNETLLYLGHLKCQMCCYFARVFSKPFMRKKYKKICILRSLVRGDMSSYISFIFSKL